MSVFDDPGSDLQWLEDELLEDLLKEEPAEEAPGKVRSFRSEKKTIADRQAVYVEKQRTGTGKYKFLAALEMIAILAVIWWWIKWLY